MGSCISQDAIQSIEKGATLILNIIRQIKEGVESLAGFANLDKFIAQLSEVSSYFSAQENAALDYIVDANKKVTIAKNYAKDAVSDTKRLAQTLKDVMQGGGSDKNDAVSLAVTLFVKGMTRILPELEKARDALSEATVDLHYIASKLKILKDWCFNKKQELQNEKSSSVTKERGTAYGSATGITLVTVVASGATMASGAVVFMNPIVVVIGVAITGATYLGAVAIAEGSTVPQIKKMYDGTIKSLDNSAREVQELADGNEVRVKNLSAELDQLREIKSTASQARDNASTLLEADCNGRMFNILKGNVEELENLCDCFLK